MKKIVIAILCLVLTASIFGHGNGGVQPMMMRSAPITWGR